ncbi:hypothetical protein Hanom_Chr09g00797561 [Helianthus anomalus]
MNSVSFIIFKSLTQPTNNTHTKQTAQQPADGLISTLQLHHTAWQYLPNGTCLHWPLPGQPH